MDGNSMITNERYLLRIKGKQVPVIYNGFRQWTGEGSEIQRSDIQGTRLHAYTRIDTGEWIFHRAARAVSKHYDSCVLRDELPWSETGMTLEEKCAFQALGAKMCVCTCRAKLEALR